MPGLRLTTRQSVLVCEVTGRFGPEMLVVMRDAHLAHASLGRTLVLALVRESSLRAGSSFSRSELPLLQRSIALLAPHTQALALVIEGRGLVPMLARTVTQASSLLSGNDFPAKVFSSEAEAERWLSQQA